MKRLWRSARNRTAVGWLVVLVGLGGCGGCGGEQRPTGPADLILISIDTLRRDHVGCYGYDRPTTPTLDRLAAEGTAFENAVSVSSWTLPSHATMLTGRYPAFHHLQDDGAKLPREIGTLAGRLGEAGYRTLAVVSHVYVSSQFGLDRGFEIFDDTLIRGGAEVPVAAAVVDLTLELFESMGPEPYFAFLHFYDPHWDYTPPPPYDSRFTDPDYHGPIDGTLASLLPYLDGTVAMPAADLQRAIDLYDGEIAYVDAEVGRLLDGLRRQGRLENAVIVVTSDHGEEFREHGRLGHQKSLFWEQLRVPLIFSGSPDFRPGTRRTDLVSLVDLVPTLLALAGCDSAAGPNPDSTAAGVSLLGGATPADRLVFAESIRFGNEMRAVRSLGHKTIHYLQGDQKHHYDLAVDPLEKRPAAADPTGGRLTAALADYSQRADSGWHLKFIALTGEPLRCRATVKTEGEFRTPRRFFSGHLQPPSGVRFLFFELSPDRRRLTFELELSHLMGEVTFGTDPPGAPVSFSLKLNGASGEAAVFLGAAERVAEPERFELVPGDERLERLPPDYTQAAPGCYLRYVEPLVSAGDRSELSEEAAERLRSLGY